MEHPNTNMYYTDPIPSDHEDEDTPEKRAQAAQHLVGHIEAQLMGETVTGPEPWRRASLAERLILEPRVRWGHEEKGLEGYQALRGHLLFRYDENTETEVKTYQITRIPHLARGSDGGTLTITQNADGTVEASTPADRYHEKQREATTKEMAAMDDACFGAPRVTLHEFDEDKEMMTTHPHYRALVRIQRKTLLRKLARFYADLRDGRTSDQY